MVETAEYPLVRKEDRWVNASGFKRICNIRVDEMSAAAFIDSESRSLRLCLIPVQKGVQH